MTNFSGAVKLADLNDFIAPSQACVVKLDDLKDKPLPQDFEVSSCSSSSLLTCEGDEKNGMERSANMMATEGVLQEPHFYFSS